MTLTMKKNILNRLLLTGCFALALASCDNEPEVESVMTSFPKYFPQLDATTPPATTLESDRETLLYFFKIDGENQNTEATIHIVPGPSSTATEHEDFELHTTEVTLAPFEGQDGFVVELEILDDLDVDEGTEEIFLTFTTDVPTGVDITQEVKVATINTCPSPALEMFTGEYEITSTSGAFGPTFEGIVELEVVGGSTRTFVGDYYGFGLELDYFISFDGCNTELVWTATDTGLGCGGGNIVLEQLGEVSFDPEDDSQFEIIIAEVEPDPTNGCGMDPEAPITLTFTKQ